MKYSTLILAFASLSSSLALACPSITGRYQCPKEAADPMALGSREVEFKYSPLLRMHAMKVNGTALGYEEGSWNPGIDFETGEIDFKVETMAECKADQVLLHAKATEGEGEISVTVEQTHEVRPTADGIELRLLIEGDEFYSFSCSKL